MASRESKKVIKYSHTHVSSETRSIHVTRNQLPNIQRNIIHKKNSMDTTIADGDSNNEINFEEMVRL